MRRVISIALMLGVMLVLAPAQALAQGELTCESDVVVQADDWLSKIAEKFYGDPLAFPAIAAATNAAAASDDSYTKIADVDIIEIGWKLCITSAAEAEALLNDPNAMVTAGVASLPDIGTIRIGYVPILAGAPFFVAKERGYFEEQGLDVELLSFVSGGLMYAPLTTGDLDVGNGQSGAGLYNAIDQGLDIRAVAPGTSQPPGFGAVPLLIRTDLADEITGPGDLQGRKIGVNVERGVVEYLLSEALATAGLTVDDVEMVTLPFPEMPGAFANSAIDAAILPHPLAARAIGEGSAVVLLEGDQIVDSPQIGLIYFGQRLLQPENHEVGVRLMSAYLKGIRAIAGEKWRDDENVAFINKYTNIPAPAIKNSVPFYFNPNGEIMRDSIARQQTYHFDRGYTELAAPLPLDQMIVDTYVAEALARLGRVQP